MKARTLILIVASSVFVSSCAVLAPPRQNSITSVETQSRPARSGVELEKQPFDGLPPYSRSYLSSLAKAFAAGDMDKLLEQGEKDYEKRVRSRVSVDEYFALLYRAGSYAEPDSPYQKARSTKIDVSKITGLTFNGWSENGPVLVVRGKLRFADGSTAPCILNILWKIDPPRILGWEL
ncbi:MAG: hypothetical protein WCT14_04710 [Treponemataceae bacterium]